MTTHISTTIDWAVEIAFLQDISVTVPRGHELAMEALVRRMQVVTPKEGALDQKVLLAKLAGECVSSIENLGALLHAIRDRGSSGIRQGYLDYKVKHTRAAFQELIDGADIKQLLNLPDIAGHSYEALYQQALSSTRTQLMAMGSTLLSNNQLAVRFYNKLKHGFVVVVRLDELCPGVALPSNWKQGINVVQGIDAQGNLEYESFVLSPSEAEALQVLVQCSCSAFRNLARTVLFLWEHGVSLDVAVPAPVDGS